MFNKPRITIFEWSGKRGTASHECWKASKFITRTIDILDLRFISASNFTQ